MQIIAWNIRCGGQGHLPEIRDVICKRDADVVVLGEYQPRASAPLLDKLKKDGWTHQLVTAPPEKRGGVAVLSKLPLVLHGLPATLEQFAYRYLPVGIPDVDLELRAIYAPLHHDPYRDYWTAVLNALASDEAQAVLAIGDFNSGESLIDSPANDVLASRYFRQLPTRGYTDLWRHSRERTYNETTWHGRVNPYRLDHAFGTTAVLNRLVACGYDHTVREAKDSDHSLLSVQLDASLGAATAQAGLTS